MNHKSLFTQTSLGPFVLRNRIVLPPLTRSRSSQPGNVPNSLMATYYRQRAGAGFMVTEGTQIEARGQGYAWTPGIHSQEQVEGWKAITQAVHAEGGVIFAQLWHVGRVSHTSLQPDGADPVGPSAIPARNVKVFIETGPGEGMLADPSTPRALSTGEVKELVQLYVQAARNALEAGFDGIEVHCANGYLVNQFISAHTNTRTDEYGGSLQNRLRFLREIAQAISDAIGADRVGIRFAPLFASTDEARVYLGLVEDDPHETYVEAVKILEEIGVAYVSLAEADWDSAPELPNSFRQAVRKAFSGKIIYAGKYTPERAAAAIEAGWADLVAFGRAFIANPDLPSRIAHGSPMNTLDPSSMYGGTEQGYTDYPAHSE
ncbi:alkene reductase [Pseudomonas sp. Choline-3u-10]|uniref:alkene reductase n=1 Tax=Pseudomonadaceae TaxID=135621 RepID=UPI000617F438|nr:MULTISPECIES: alkene reductase [Pseudomonadaceae]MAL37106.1 alkene reductase [Pseudomonas sp.]MBU0950961.1 alkene reductase [Gammaproteobacteria bacterium]KJJ62541.1 oxidoreductase [Pseudomonas sp. 10B238]MBK3794179.1 alkene reductase [Stutzerimonas stutzeri]MBK3875669.1 alkene reductase [Stutzerimonas stutzeri]